jgi:dTDP-4-dehydrorhamnose 3,5-epimerase
VKVTPKREIPEVLVIEPDVHRDPRGFFLETWHENRFAASGLKTRFVQDNHSYSVRGTLRGLHYQVENPQGKLVRVVRGEVLDVAVDLRSSSSTFGRWVYDELSADLLYKCTAYYSAANDRGIRWDDPDIGIDWKLLDGCPPILSPKDAAAPLLRDAVTYP